MIGRVRRLAPAERERLRIAILELRAENGPMPEMAEALVRRLLAETGAPAEGEARLVEKLALSAELRPGLLLKALKEGRLSLFEAALARLGGYRSEDVAAAVASEDKPELLALALAGISIDQSAFPTILALVRGLTGGRPVGGEAAARRALGAFAQFAPETAAEAFRRSLAG
jgi:uncharacterized protein (DUF2336 family)